MPSLPVQGKIDWTLVLLKHYPVAILNYRNDIPVDTLSLDLVSTDSGIFLVAYQGAQILVHYQPPHYLVRRVCEVHVIIPDPHCPC